MSIISIQDVDNFFQTISLSLSGFKKQGQYKIQNSEEGFRIQTLIFHMLILDKILHLVQK